MALSSIQLSLLGIPQERIAQKLQESRETIRRYLVDLVTWPNQPNADLKKGFAVARVADRQQFTNLTTGESYTGRLPITGNQQIYLPVEIQKMLEGSGNIRIQILGGWSFFQFAKVSENIISIIESCKIHVLWSMDHCRIVVRAFCLL